jgi:hypothetical protein
VPGRKSGKIFINYRRGDDPGAVQALFARLEQSFRPECLFMDVDNIAPGLDFVEVLNEQVGQCDVVISVIGSDWLDARDESGARRLENPKDFVRIEIESALATGKLVIPVLVGHAQMPREDQLPESLKPLARRNAVRLTHERFRSDVQGLVAALQRALKAADDERKRGHRSSLRVSLSGLPLSVSIVAALLIFQAVGLIVLSAVYHSSSQGAADSIFVVCNILGGTLIFLGSWEIRKLVRKLGMIYCGLVVLFTMYSLGVLARFMYEDSFFLWTPFLYELPNLALYSAALVIFRRWQIA